MAGPYCRFCGRRCFVLRRLPEGVEVNGVREIHMATCGQGARHDQEALGVNFRTAENPLEPVAVAPEQDEGDEADALEQAAFVGQSAQPSALTGEDSEGDVTLPKRRRG